MVKIEKKRIIITQDDGSAHMSITGYQKKKMRTLQSISLTNQN